MATNSIHSFTAMEEEAILNASLEHSLLALLIDESSSMYSIKETADMAIDVFLRVLRSFEDVSGVLDLAVGKYNDAYTMVQPFRAVSNSLEAYQISPDGCTRADIAIPAMLDAVQEYKHSVLKPNKVAYHRAFVFHITDGASQGDLTDAAYMVRKLEASKSIVFYTIAVPGANIEQIKLYCQNIIDLTNEGEKLDEVLPRVLAAIATLSASGAAAKSGSSAIAATVNDGAASKAAAILSSFGLEEK
ncbi:MAG: hypothetical protein IJ111_05500 [Eggerthellaceae bacterium]|nr:hypothetical protein [Eggerthellaceae bacterium]